MKSLNIISKTILYDADGMMPDFKKERPFHAQTVCKGPGPHQL